MFALSACHARALRGVAKRQISSRSEGCQKSKSVHTTVSRRPSPSSSPAWYRSTKRERVGRVKRNDRVTAAYNTRERDGRDRLSDLGFQDSDLRFRDLEFGFRVSGFGFRDSGVKIRFSGFGYMVSNLGIRNFGFGFQFRVSGFGVGVHGFGFRDAACGFWNSGFRYGACNLQKAVRMMS